MSTTGNQQPEPPPTSSVPHHTGHTANIDTKLDSFPTYSQFFVEPQIQPRRPVSSINSSSGMDAQPSYSSPELAANPDGHSDAVLNITSSQFIPSFQPFGNMQGIDSMTGGGGGSGEVAVTKLTLVDDLLDRYEVSLLLINPLSSHSRELLVSHFVCGSTEFIWIGFHTNVSNMGACTESCVPVKTLVRHILVAAILKATSAFQNLKLSLTLCPHSLFQMPSPLLHPLSIRCRLCPNHIVYRLHPVAHRLERLVSVALPLNFKPQTKMLLESAAPLPRVTA